MRTVFLVMVLAVALSGCAPAGPAADSPGGTVQAALGKLAAKDLDGLRTLACAGQEDVIRDQLGLAGLGSGADLLPGLDTQAVLDAVTFDVAQVRFGDAKVDGDVANVPVSGSVKVTFDAARMRPLVRQVFEGQGTTMTDEQLDALIKTLQTYGQTVPIRQTIRLVREGGAWKVCQDAIEAPETP